MSKAAEINPAGDTRELILRAALQAFSEKGFDGASTREIATRANVNHGLIQYYFGGKPKLWRAVVDRAFEELTAELDAIREDVNITDEMERAGLLIRSFVHYVGHHPEFVRLMHEEGKRRGPRMRYLVDHHVKPMYQIVQDILGRARERGLLPLDIPLVHFHYILAGAVSLIFHQAEECKRVSGVDPGDESVIEEHARAVEYLLLGSVQREKPA